MSHMAVLQWKLKAELKYTNVICLDTCIWDFYLQLEFNWISGEKEVKNLSTLCL